MASNVLGNAVLGDAYMSVAAEAFKNLVHVLGHHCGPLARYSYIFQKSSMTTTCDGITLIRQTRAVDRVSEFARQQAEYMGSRVDAINRDGTTTAMMLLSGVLYRIMENHKQFSNPRKLQADILRVLDVLENCVRNATHTVDSLVHTHGISEKRARAFFVWNTTLMASKGDYELAKALFDVVMATPPDRGLNEFVISNVAVETADEPAFKALTRPYDFWVDGFVLNLNTVGNHRMNTEFKADGVNLFVYDNELHPGDRVYEELHALFSGLVESGEALDYHHVILARQVSALLVSLVTEYNLKHDKKIVLGTYIAEFPEYKLYVPRAIRAMAGRKSFAELLAEGGEDTATASLLHAFIPGVTVHAYSDRIELSNLYEKTGALRHPYADDPAAWPAYTEFLAEVTETIKDKRNRHNLTEKDIRFVNALVGVRRAMISQKIVDLQLSGATHDVLTNKSVAIDANGAAMSALEDGIIVNGIGKMFRALGQLDQELDSVAIYFREALRDILIATYTGSVKTIETVTASDADALQLIEEMGDRSANWGDDWYLWISKMGVMSVCDATSAACAPWDDPGRRPQDFVVMQTTRGYLEIIRRLRELLPRLAVGYGIFDAVEVIKKEFDDVRNNAHA